MNVVHIGSILRLLFVRVLLSNTIVSDFLWGVLEMRPNTNVWRSQLRRKYLHLKG